MLNTVYMTKGLPGSGKSTAAKAYAKESIRPTDYISIDDLRTELHGGEFSRKNEKQVLEARDDRIIQSIIRRRDVIVDATHLNPKHEAHIRAMLLKYFPDNSALDTTKFDMTGVHLEECIARNRKRSNAVPVDVILGMYKKSLHVPVSAPAFSLERQGCILADLDGTLATLGDRSPYDAAQCHLDTVNESVRYLMYLVQAKGLAVILLSGRDETHRPQTEKWLADNSLTYDALFMRPAEDRRKDYIVKEELYRAHIEGKYNVRFAVDDRPQVVRMWRYTLGIPVLNVGEGIEF